MDAGKIRRLFQAAIDLGADERKAFLDSASISQEERNAVLALLAYDRGEDADSLLLGPIAEARRQVVSGRFGAYEIQQEIGRGGMGAVYKAERADGEVRQVVAIKILDREWLDPKTLERFRRERQILSGLAHPNIARLLDTGTRDDGRPYLVMEFIEGERLDQYCQKHNPSIREKLRLFLPVCRAAEYAHSKLVIHRDLKPSNILVTPEGEPKLLDFGIASALDAASGPSTDTLVLTPQFACPDQARGEPPSTAADVYGLGALLYFLLAGQAPHETDGMSPLELVRYLSETEPAAPASLRAELKGDLDNIVRKAMHLEPSRRYGSARELAEDVERYLSLRPVLATPDSLWYRTRRFVARRRWLVAGAAAALLAVTVAGAYAWASRQRANEEAAIAKAVNEFLQNDLLSQAGTRSQAERGAKGDADLKVRTVLDRAALSVPQKFGRLPKVEASIRLVIGNAYRDLGLDQEAQTHYQRALDLYRKATGRGSREAMDTANLLGETYARLGKRKEAEAVYQENLASAGGSREERLAAASARRGLAMLLSAAGKRREAVPVLQQAIREMVAVAGPEHENTLSASSDLASLQSQVGDVDEAETLFRQILDTRRRVLGGRHPDTLASLNELGLFYRNRGRQTEAETLLKEASAGFEATLGGDHPSTLNSLFNLGQVYNSLGQYGKSEQLDLRVLEAQRRLRGSEHPETLAAANNLAVDYQLSGKYALAASLYEETLAAKRKSLGDEHPSTWLAMRNLGSIYREMGKPAESARLIEEALRITRRVMGVHLDTAAAINELARTRKASGSYAEAEQLFRESLAMRTKLLGAQHQATLVAMNDLAGLYQATGRITEAEKLFQETLAARRKVLGETHPSTLNTMSDLAGLYRSQRRTQEAFRLAEQVLEGRRKTLGEDHPATLRAMRDLAALQATR